MRTSIQIILTLFSPFLFVNTGICQSYINKEWVNTTTVTNDEFNRTSTVTNNGKLYITSNIIDGSDTDVLTIAYNSNGDTLWLNTQSGTSTDGDDYGTNLALTPWGDVVVVAAILNSSSNYDYGVYHYNGSTGVLNWSYTWNGAANGIDIPSSVTSDDIGNIYIAGGSETGDGTSDFGIVKLSSSGTFLWSTYYDYAGFHDAATNVTIKNKVIVSGGSSAGIGDWDIATLNLNPNTGAIVATNRTDIPDATIAEATAMKSDEENNIYITGFAEVGGDKNIQTIKLDSLLNPIWIAEYNGDLDDFSNDLELDDLGNVYVTGYSDITADKSKAITIKYSPDGDTLWTKLYGNTVTENGAESRALKVDDDGSVFITGSANEGGLNSMLLVKYDSDGNLLFSKRHAVPTSQNNGFEIELDSNSVYITGFTSSGGSNQMSTLRYSIKEKDTSLYRHPTTNLPMYVDRELIVSVHPDMIKTAEIDDLDKQFWTISDIFIPSFANQLNTSLSGLCQGAQDCPITVYRIFKHQTTDDTLSISRLGDTVRVPKFWSTFLFEFKEGADITSAAADISNLFPSINYVTYNLVGYLDDVPNDPEYALRQRSLHEGVPVIWDENHINVEPAWDYENGKSWIRVGILDTPVEWEHEDFGGEDDTKVKGYDFILDESIYTAEPVVSPHHGTAVAGIVGAIRNNEMGVAGIAGGDYVEGDISTRGVTLYGYNTTTRDGDGDVIIILDHIAETVYNTAKYLPDSEINVGLNIMNNSWGVSNAPYYGDPDNPWFLDTNITLLRESFHFANRNKVTVVASRGNSGEMQDEGVYHYNYPGVLDEDWILCVGGTGTDGNYHNGDHPFEYDFKTSQGWEIDVSAASCGSHNWTTIPDDGYNVFGGTSAAAPHAAGVAALLMGYLNEAPFPSYNNLAPEDIEYILETTALDVDIVGVDSLTGHGRVDAGAAMEQVDKDDYLLKHFGSDAFPFTPTFEAFSTNDTIQFTERHGTDDDVWFLPDHNYIVNTYRITATVEHSIIPGQEIIASWERHSSSNPFALFDENNEIEPRERVELLSVTDTEAELEGYIYEVKDSTGAFISWVPFGPDDPENPFYLAYSLLIEDTVAFAGNDENKLNNSLQVFPNPTKDVQSIVVTMDQPIDGSIRLVDVQGKVVLNIFEGTVQAGETYFDVDLSKLPSGVYFYMVTINEDEVYQYKVIKQ